MSLLTLFFTNISSFSFPLPVEFLSFLSFNVWGLELVLIKNKAEARESLEMFHSHHPLPLHQDCPQGDFRLATSLPSSPSSSNMCSWQQHDGSQDGRFYPIQLMSRRFLTLNKCVIKIFILISTGIPLQLSPRLQNLRNSWILKLKHVSMLGTAYGYGLPITAYEAVMVSKPKDPISSL